MMDAIVRVLAHPNRVSVADGILKILEWQTSSEKRSLGEIWAAEMAKDTRLKGATDYARKMIRNRVIDEARRANRAIPFDHQATELGGSTADDIELPLLLRQEAQRLLHDLRPNDRELLLAYLEGSHAFEDVRTRQQLSSSTARVRVHRIIKRLRDDETETSPDDSPQR